MGSVRKEDIPEVAKFMPLLWELIKKYYIPEDTDEYWDALIADANKAWSVCRETQVGLFLLHGLFSYLEEKQDGGKISDKPKKKKKLGAF